MKALTSHDIQSQVALKARELELEARLLARPEVQAQRIHCELIKELERNAPWLLPMIMR